MKKLILHIIRSYGISLILSCGLAGCSDFLDKYPTSSISNETFWNNENDAKLALIGCYAFHNGWTNDDFATPQGLLYLDLAGGYGSEKEGFTTNMAGTNTLSTNSNINGYWQNAYRLIARYNIFLKNIVNCPMDEERKNTMIGEVKSLRAFMFLKLAFYFKDVPMPLTTMTAQEANSIPQTFQEDVYKQVETDLTEAIKVLPLKYSSEEYGRLTQGAAKVMLSRLYLAEKRWADAATILKQVIDSKEYQLDRRNGDDSYEKLFQIGGETSPEMIFFIQGLKDKFTTVRYIYMYPEALGGWHQFAVYNELIQKYFCADGKDIETSEVYNEDDPYTNRDIRLYASVFLPPVGTYTGTVFNNKTYTCFGKPGSADYFSKFPKSNGYCPKKGADASVEDLYNVPTYTPVIRYAEVLLSYLEALNESAPNAVTQEILNITINDVRERVKLPAIKKEDFPTQALVRKAVRREREVELAFEGLHYFDVLRWDVAKDELNKTFHGVKLSDNKDAPNYKGTNKVDKNNYYEFEERKWDTHNRYFPIPQNDLNINKNLKQNEGYN